MKINPQSFFNFCANHAPSLRAFSERGKEPLFAAESESRLMTDVVHDEKRPLKRFDLSPV